MLIFTPRILRFSLIIYMFLIYLFITRCVCIKQSITLDTKLKVQDDDIEKIVKFRKWTTFKVKDSTNKRIGEVKHGSIVVMEESPEDIIERIVYFKPLKRIQERYIIKIITKYDKYPHTVEFIIEDKEDNQTCIKVIREQIDVDIDKTDNSAIKITSSQNGWLEYSIQNDLSLQYRIGKISDGNTEIVSDAENSNIRLRYLHVSRRGFIDDLIKACLPCLPRTDPKVVRVFTYYHTGERSFDEYIESYRGRTKRYIDLVKQSIDLNIDRLNPRYFNKVRIDSQTYLYTVSDEFKHKNKIGNVLNNRFLVVNDDNNIRLRTVYTNKDDTKFEHVEVKTCYRRGDCQKCKYIFEDNKYIKSTCKIEKDNPQDPGSSPNLFVSNEELDKISKKDESYLNTVVSFNETQPSVNDIIVDISDPRSSYFIIDLLPLYGGLFYSLKKEHIGKSIRLKIFDGTNLLSNINLEKAKEVEFIIKIGKVGERRLFMWTKCGIELQKGHEMIVIDSLKRITSYKTRKMDQKPSEIITTMVN